MRRVGQWRFLSCEEFKQLKPTMRLLSCGCSEKRAANQETRPPESSIRSFHEIPTKRGLLESRLGLVLSGGPGYLHEHCDKRHRELGPIFRERLGSQDLIFVASTRMIQTVIANEGPQPRHNVPEAWTLYNQERRIERGLFFQQGDTWLKLRRAFNRVMLADVAKIRRFSRDLLGVNNDLMDNWQRTHWHGRSGNESGRPLECDTRGREVLLRDVKFELCRWSIEATGLMLFGQRMGCLLDDDNSRAKLLVDSVARMFSETSKFHVIPAEFARKFNLRPWQRFMSASDTMLALAREYADKFIAEAKSPGGPVYESLVKDLLDAGALSDDEISRSMVDLIIAAADTTSNSLQWMFYMLAKHPEAQTRIFGELRQLDDWKLIQTASTPYLNGFIKEVSRLYPTAPFIARSLEHAIVLDTYEIPANKPIIFSLFTTSRMDEYFKEPLEFKPERWLRDAGHLSSAKPKASPSHAHATLPFGIGSRMCIGRRMANLEMHLLIASIVSRFEVSMAKPNEEIKIKLKMILGPDKPISVRLKPRPQLNEGSV